MTGPLLSGPIDPDTEPLPADLYLPAAERPAPVVLFPHGGGWAMGSRARFCPTWADWRPGAFSRLVAAGFAVASSTTG